MKNLALTLLLSIAVLGCKNKVETAFSKAALNDQFTTLQDTSVTFQSILNQNKGKKIVVDIWASWCRDCITGIPKVKQLQAQFPDVAYVFLSLDKNVDLWKKSIKKYNLSGQHYYMHNGKNSAFAKFVTIDWIPRYMVVDENGAIKLFKAITADDPKIIEYLK